MYLLDTDILSNLVRPVPSARLVAKLESVPPDLQFTSSISVGELMYGAYRAGPRRATLLPRIQAVLGPSLVVLPFDEPAARCYAEVRAHLEQQGTPIGDADVRIAAIALVRGLVVVTGNVRHFLRVPALTVENWLESRIPSYSWPVLARCQARTRLSARTKSQLRA
jgi:predicted nucleic acid-binding protein